MIIFIFLSLSFSFSLLSRVLFPFSFLSRTDLRIFARIGRVNFRRVLDARFPAIPNDTTMRNGATSHRVSRSKCVATGDSIGIASISRDVQSRFARVRSKTVKNGRRRREETGGAAPVTFVRPIVPICDDSIRYRVEKKKRKERKSAPRTWRGVTFPFRSSTRGSIIPDDFPCEF